MGMNVEEQRQDVVTAAPWEQAAIAIHILTLGASAAVGLLNIGWPGLWWQIPAVVWGGTVAIGIGRSILRRVPDE